MDLGF